jgi:hypothetical protein
MKALSTNFFFVNPCVFEPLSQNNPDDENDLINFIDMETHLKLNINWRLKLFI